MNEFSWKEKQEEKFIRAAIIVSINNKYYFAAFLFELYSENRESRVKHIFSYEAVILKRSLDILHFIMKSE